MIDNTIIIALIILILIINSFVVGYLLGRSSNNTGVLNTKTQSFFKQQDSLLKDNSSIFIDDKKFVVDIKTEGLEKKYDSLGDIKKSEENISNSVNKLKNLKR
jgi:pectate lyase